MVKGSTPTFTVMLPTNESEIASVEVYFVQDGKVKASFGLDRIVIDDNIASFTLSERETIGFSEGSNAEMQLTLRTNDGNVLVSPIKKIPIRKKYPEEVMI